MLSRVYRAYFQAKAGLRVRPRISRALRWAELRAAQGARRAAYWSPVRNRRATRRGDADRPNQWVDLGLRRQAAICGVAPPRRTPVGTPSSSRLGAGRLPPQPMVCQWAGPICVAGRRCSSLAYWLPVRRTPRALRGSHLGPAQGTGDSGTHSKSETWNPELATHNPKLET